MSATIRLRKDDEISGNECKKCHGLRLTEDQLPEHSINHAREKDRNMNAKVANELQTDREETVSNEGQQQSVSHENLEQESDNILEQSSERRTDIKGVVTIRKQAAASRKVPKDKRTKHEKALKKAENAKARLERVARTIALVRKRESANLATSGGKQNNIATKFELSPFELKMMAIMENVECGSAPSGHPKR